MFSSPVNFFLLFLSSCFFFSVFLSVISLLLGKTSSRQSPLNIRLFTCFLRVGHLLQKGKNSRISEHFLPSTHPVIAQHLLSPNSEAQYLRASIVWHYHNLASTLSSLYPLLYSKPDNLDHLSLAFIFNSICPLPSEHLVLPSVVCSSSPGHVICFLPPNFC